MKFLCDKMLGTLAKWLRIYGFDTFYANSETTDDEVLMIAKKENRVLITRDKKLVYQARRENLKVIETKLTNIDELLKYVLKDIKIDQNMILSRCLLCNSLVDEIKKEDATDKVPERVYQSNDKFWYCPSCKKVYWNGSHYDKMLEKIDNIKK